MHVGEKSHQTACAAGELVFSVSQARVTAWDKTPTSALANIQLLGQSNLAHHRSLCGLSKGDGDNEILQAASLPNTQ